MLFVCTVLHFAVDGVCGAVLADYAVNEEIFSNIVHYFSVYSVIAFGGQWFAGLILDRHKNLLLPFLCAAPVFLAGGLIDSAEILFQAVSLAVGNCLFHVAGGVLILERSQNFREPGIFVSSGAAGLGLGLHRLISAFVFEALCLFFTAIAIFRLVNSPTESPSPKNPVPERGSLLPIFAGAALLLVCVVLRGFGGGSPLPEYVMLMPCVFMLGKSAGGILCDSIGFRKTILAIFLMCFAGLQLEGLARIITLAFAFNMTMPLTLRLLHWYFPEHPGLTFGLAAGCLLPGALLGESITIPADVMSVVQFVGLFGAGYVFIRFGRGNILR